MKRILKAILFSFIAISAMGQGSTTSGINGRVLDDKGESLPGATILAIHEASGSQYGAITDFDGFFRLPNMDVGGPYLVKVSYVGYDAYEQKGIFLSLGQTYKLDAKLGEATIALEGAQVVGRTNDYRIIDGNRTGAETVIGVEQIESLPTVSRQLTDYVRLTPQASVDDNGAISIAGANNRYNSISIDGAVNNDVFGLSPTGTNGGQTGGTPISMDAIDQFQVVLAPFDVRQSGFVGGGINAVTRRGTNDVKASVYYYTRNENFAGKTPGDMDNGDREKLAEFSAKTYGVRIGGPIVKNKIHYFISLEQQREETPQPYSFSDSYRGNSSLEEINQIRDRLINVYGYDPGGFEKNTKKLESDKYLARLDFNLSQQHKLMFRHSYVKNVSETPSRSTDGAINFFNRGVYFPSTTNSTALELKSNLDKASNSLMVTYTSVRDDRDPMGSDFPALEIWDGSATIYAGSEPYSTGNQLDQDVITVTDNFTIYKGKHTITVGTNNEFSQTYNLFVRRAYGEYRYSSVQDFLGDSIANRYRRGFSMVDNVRGDGSAAAAEFGMVQLGIYAQDEIQVSDRLKVTAGIRFDMPIFSDDPMAIPGFDTTLAKIEARGIDTYGAESGAMPDPQILISPRIGFNFDVNGDQTTQIRGGLGIFTSRLPLVWPGGAYTNNGLTTGSYTSYSERLNADINQQPPLNQESDSPVGGQVDLFASDFKYPQMFKANLAIDHKLPVGLVATVEGIFSKTLNNVHYYNINVAPSTKNMTNSGNDTRPLYNGYGSKIEGFYDHIMVGTNTNEGYAYNITAQLQKPMIKNIAAGISYTFGRSMSINDATSSQNSSQWIYLQTAKGKNDIELSYSKFDLGSRITGYVTYQAEYLRALKTTFSLFYNGQSGDRVSFVYNKGIIGDDIWAANNDLIYVPASASEINLVDITDSDGNVTLSAAQQWADLADFIENNDYLKERKGKYAERNGERLPFWHNFDLRIAQDVFVNTGSRRQTVQVTFDLFNVANFLNPDWGRKHYVSYGNYTLIDFEGWEDDGTTPQYTFNRPDDEYYYIDDSGIKSSRWQAQLGVRYIF